MELYAAMVENLDGHVGRLLAHLEDIGQLDNTLVVFMSDNGGAGEDFYNEGPFVAYLRRHYDNAYEKMGTRESFVSYDDPWAEAGSAPFSRIKTYTREGGIVAPFIVAGPGVAGRGTINESYVTVMDLAPTFLELARATYPESPKLRPMLGESMVDFLAGTSPAVHDDRYVTVLFHGGRAFLRQGDWKLATLEAPFDETQFALFNVAVDPGETSDLRLQHPDRYAELLALWRQERRRMGIILPEDL
jgi:arylsulfatase